MGVLPDWMVERDVKITPFQPGIKRPGEISSGLTSYGYDVRCGYVFKIFSPINATVIDPKDFDPKALVTVDVTPRPHELVEGKNNRYCKTCNLTEHSLLSYGQLDDNCDRIPNHILIPPHSFALAESYETFTIPRDVLCIVLGKSTYARTGLIVNVTPGEPEWTGKWTIELSNTTQLPIKVYAAEGIMQCVFIRGEATCRTSYADKAGKYQAQAGLTLPKVDGDKK